jgi:hypothetical protein
MQADQLLDQFNERRRSPDLPLVLQDEVEVLDGVYAGKRGEVVVLAYAESPMQFLVEFGDGTDEYFPARSLKLLRPDA